MKWTKLFSSLSLEVVLSRKTFNFLLTKNRFWGCAHAQKYDGI